MPATKMEVKMTPQQEQYRRAVLRARSMLPMWNSFVRILAKNRKLRVQLSGKGSYTDGETVWIGVDPALGLEIPHKRSLCGMADENGLAACPGCFTEEDMMVSVFHECAHIVLDSFAEIPQDQQVAIVKKAVMAAARVNPTRRAEAIAKRVNKIVNDSRKKVTFMEVCNAISPFMPFFFNAVEDTRVNEGMLTARPGCRALFTYQFEVILDKGCEQPDGTWKLWRDADLNSQVSIATNAVGDGVSIEGRFHPDVVKHVSQPEITELIEQVRTCRNVGETFAIALDLFEMYYALGYFHDDSDPEPEQGDGDPEDSDQESGDGDQEGSGGGGSGDSDDESEEGGSGGGGADAESGGDKDDSGDSPGGPGSPQDGDDGGATEPDSGGASNAPGYGTPEDLDANVRAASRHDKFDHDPADSPEDGGPTEPPESKPHGDRKKGMAPVDYEMMESAISQAEWFEGPSANVTGLVVVKDQKVGTWSHGFQRDHAEFETSESILGPALMKLRLAFAENRRTRVERSRKTGKIDGRTLGKRIPVERDDFFKKRIIPGKRDYFVIIGIDVSGSTAGRTVSMIKKAAFAQADLLDRLGIRFAVYAHSGAPTGFVKTGAYGRFDRSNGIEVTMFEVKGPNDRWDNKAKGRLASLEGFACNLDGHTLEFYRKLADRDERSTNKVILYYTDGAMPAENYDEEREILEREIKTCRRKGHYLVGVALQCDDPEQYGLDTVRIDDPSEVNLVVEKLTKVLKG